MYNIFFFLPVFPLTFFCLFSSFLRWELKCSYAMSRMQDQWLVLFLPSAILLASFHKSSIFSPAVLKKSDIIIMKMFCHMYLVLRVTVITDFQCRETAILSAIALIAQHEYSFGWRSKDRWTLAVDANALHRYQDARHSRFGLFLLSLLEIGGYLNWW